MNFPAIDDVIHGLSHFRTLVRSGGGKDKTQNRIPEYGIRNRNTEPEYGTGMRNRNAELKIKRGIREKMQNWDVFETCF